MAKEATCWFDYLDWVIIRVAFCVSLQIPDLKWGVHSFCGKSHERPTIRGEFQAIDGAARQHRLQWLARRNSPENDLLPLSDEVIDRGREDVACQGERRNTGVCGLGQSHLEPLASGGSVP